MRQLARTLRTGQIGRMSEDEKHHAAARGNAAAPPTETDGARKRNRQKDGTGTGSGIGIGKGNGTGNNNRNWNYRLLHRKTKIGAESGTLTEPKNRNPDGTENGAVCRRYAPKNNYGPNLCTKKQVWGKVVQNKQTRRYSFVQHSVLQNDAIFATM